MTDWRRGEPIKITVAGIGGDLRTVDGIVVIASPNGKSLMIAFDAMIDGHAGMMPLFQEDDGSYAALMTGKPVKIERA